MSCCGKSAATAVSVAKGNLLRIAENAGLLPENIKELKESRIAVCDGCEMLSWYSVHEYAVWLAANAKGVLRNLSDLASLPVLEKKLQSSNTDKVCRLCKCWLNSKVLVENEKCPLNKW